MGTSKDNNFISDTIASGYVHENYKYIGLVNAQFRF